jgi:hypothetical protein
MDFFTRMWTAIDNCEKALERIAVALEVGKATDPIVAPKTTKAKTKAVPEVASATPVASAPSTPITPAVPATVASVNTSAPATADPLDFGDTKLEPVTPELLREKLNQVIEKVGKDVARKIVVEVGNAQSFSLIKPEKYGDILVACAEALK